MPFSTDTISVYLPALEALISSVRALPPHGEPIMNASIGKRIECHCHIPAPSCISIQRLHLASVVEATTESAEDATPLYPPKRWSSFSLSSEGDSVSGQLMTL